MKKKILLTLGAAALVAGAGVAVASGKYCDEEGRRGGDRQAYEQHGGYGHHEGSGDMRKDGGKMSGHMLDRMGEHLQLTAEQKEKIQSIFQAQAEQQLAQRESMQSFHQQMRDLDPTSADYVAAVQKLAEARADNMMARMVDRAQVKADIFAVLTPEQRAEMKNMQARHGMKEEHREGYNH